MPKTKKRVETSDSDSGPEDRGPAKKKPAPSKPAAKSKVDEEEPSWPLDKMKFIKVREFRGQVYVDIREYYEDKNDGELKPGKKGISLNATAFQKLKAVISEVDEALSKK